MTTVDIDATHPEQRRPRRRPPAAAGARVVAAEVHRVVEGARAGRLPGQRRLPAHRDLRRPGGLGQLRLREDARLPLGHLPRRPRARPAHRASATTSASRSGRRCPASTAPTCAACVVVQGDTEPASVEQQRAPVPHRAEPLRPAQPVPGERRGGPPPVGDGVPAAPLLRPRRPRRGRRDARAPLRRPRPPAHPRRVQRADARLAVVLLLHLLHRPRRQVPAGLAARERASTRCRARATSC